MTDQPIGAAVAANIRAEMARRNVTQEKLAEVCDVDRTTVNAWLTGRREISLSKLEKVAGALAVPMSTLIA